MMSPAEFRCTSIIVFIVFLAASCTTSAATLESGMTAEQAIQAMGQPDLRDTVTDPQRGTQAARYVWLRPGKAAILGPDNRIASIQDVTTAAAAPTEPRAQRPRPPSQPFDVVNTPLNYAAYPFKVAVIYFAAGLNCVAAGQCEWPEVRGPNEV
jgi:hypothetical protein